MKIQDKNTNKPENTWEHNAMKQLILDKNNKYFSKKKLNKILLKLFSPNKETGNGEIDKTVGAIEIKHFPRKKVGTEVTQ